MKPARSCFVKMESILPTKNDSILTALVKWVAFKASIQNISDIACQNQNIDGD